MSIVERAIPAVVIGIVVTLVCILVGGLLASLDIGLAVVVGSFLKAYATVLGILAALWRAFPSRPL